MNSLVKLLLDAILHVALSRSTKIAIKFAVGSLQPFLSYLKTFDESKVSRYDVLTGTPIVPCHDQRYRPYLLGHEKTIIRCLLLCLLCVSYVTYKNDKVNIGLL